MSRRPRFQATRPQGYRELCGRNKSTVESPGFRRSGIVQPLSLPPSPGRRNATQDRTMTTAPKQRPKYYDLNLAHLPAPGLALDLPPHLRARCSSSRSFPRCSTCCSPRSAPRPDGCTGRACFARAGGEGWSSSASSGSTRTISSPASATCCSTCTSASRRSRRAPPRSSSSRWARSPRSSSAGGSGEAPTRRFPSARTTGSATGCCSASPPWSWRPTPSSCWRSCSGARRRATPTGRRCSRAPSCGSRRCSSSSRSSTTRGSACATSSWTT